MKTARGSGRSDRFDPQQRDIERVTLRPGKRVEAGVVGACEQIAQARVGEPGLRLGGTGHQDPVAALRGRVEAGLPHRRLAEAGRPFDPQHPGTLDQAVQEMLEPPEWRIAAHQTAHGPMLHRYRGPRQGAARPPDRASR